VEEHDVAITWALGSGFDDGLELGEVIALTSYDNDSNWMSMSALTDGHLGELNQ